MSQPVGARVAGSTGSKSIRLFMVPLLFTGMLQLSGCTSEEVTRPQSPPPGGVYLSESAGASFGQSVQREDAEAQNIAPFNLQRAHRPSHAPQTIYIAAGSRGIVRSTNGGASWVVLRVPLAIVTDIVSLESGVLIASGADSEGQGYILRSGDEAKSWETVLTIPTPIDTDSSFQIINIENPASSSVIISVEPDPFNPERVYAGSNLGSLLVGEQSGKTWRTLEVVTENGVSFSSDRQRFGITEIMPSPHTAHELLVLTASQQLFRVKDRAASEVVVREHQEGLFAGPERRVFDITYVKQFPDAFLVSTEDGAYYSRDAGQTWERLGLPINVEQQFNSTVVAVSPTNAARMFVGINNVLYRSEDGGQTWSTVPFYFKTHVITSLLIDPTNAARMLLVMTPVRV